MHRLLFAAAFAAIAFSCSEARAQEDFEFGVGVQGNFGAAFIDQPSDQLVGSTAVKPEYPGFSGSSVGGGPFVDLRFFEYFGVEVDFFFQKEIGSTDITITNVTTHEENVFELEIGHDGWHIPLLFKGIFLPDLPATPVLGLGPEFVLPGDTFPAPGESPIISGQNTTATQYGVLDAESYIRFLLAIGFEISIPIPSDVLSHIRIPFQIRGAFDTGLDDTRAAREDTDMTSCAAPPCSIKYRPEWEFQVGATFGVAMYF